MGINFHGVQIFVDFVNYNLSIQPLIPVCNVGNKAISWKLNTFWMAFGCGALIDQLHGQKLFSQGACK